MNLIKPHPENERGGKNDRERERERETEVCHLLRSK